MPSTVQDLVVAAYGLSNRNVPAVLSTTGFQSELTAKVTRLQREVYSRAAKINPTFFAGLQDVAFLADSDGELAGWARPTGANTLFRIEWLAGTVGGAQASAKAGDLVVLVPYDDRAAETGFPAIYRVGETYFSAGNALDPIGGPLRFFFSRVPTDPSGFTGQLDSMWLDTFDGLLVVQIAEYLAAKDGRADELGPLKDEETARIQEFTDLLAHPDANERRRMGVVRRVVSPTLAPVVAG